MPDKDYSIAVPLPLVARFATISLGYTCYLSKWMIQLI